MYSFTPEIEHVTLIAAVRLEMASDWARLRRAAMRIGSPVVQLANIEGDGISDCRPLVLNDYSSFDRAWNSIDYVFGDPDYEVAGNGVRGRACAYRKHQARRDRLSGTRMGRRSINPSLTC